MDTRPMYASDYSAKVWDLVKDAVLIGMAHPFQGVLSWGVDYDPAPKSEDALRAPKYLTVTVYPRRNMVVWVTDDSIGGFDTLASVLPEINSVAVLTRKDLEAEIETRSRAARGGYRGCPPWTVRLKELKTLDRAVNSWAERFANASTSVQYKSAARAVVKHLPDSFDTLVTELPDLFRNGSFDRAMKQVKPTVRPVAKRFVRELRERCGA